MFLSKIRKLGNFLFFFIVMLFYFECVFLIVLTMIILTLIRYNKAKCFIKRVWIHLTMSALGFYFPKPMFIYYDPRILTYSKNIIISNHLSEFDWLMILTILYKLNRFDNICIILKNSLQNIPLLGYGMKYFGYIFLNRKIEKDREIINEGIERLKKEGDFDLLLFPEGTYLDSESSPVCQKYMEKNPAFLDKKEFRPEEVLLPRVTGFDLIRQSLMNSSIENKGFSGNAENKGFSGKVENRGFSGNMENKGFSGKGNSPPSPSSTTSISSSTSIPSSTSISSSTQNKNVDGVIDITMLVNPYKKFPQDDYSYTKTLTDFKDRIGFVFYLDYVENIKDRDFIFRRFKIKDELIKKYKKLNMKEIKTEKEFKRLTRLLNRENMTHKYDTICVQSEWGPFFYILFIFSVFLISYQIKCYLH